MLEYAAGLLGLLRPPSARLISPLSDPCSLVHQVLDTDPVGSERSDLKKEVEGELAAATGRIAGLVQQLDALKDHPGALALCQDEQELIRTADMPTSRPLSSSQEKSLPSCTCNLELVYAPSLHQRQPSFVPTPTFICVRQRLGCISSPGCLARGRFPVRTLAVASDPVAARRNRPQRQRAGRGWRDSGGPTQEPYERSAAAQRVGRGPRRVSRPTRGKARSPRLILLSQ